MGPTQAAALVVVGLLCLAVGGLALVRRRRGDRLRDWLSTRVRHRGLRAQPLQPEGRPIQEIVADLRRLGARFHRLEPGSSYAKVEGVRSAYDRALGECCASLGLTHLLGVLGPGPELDRERERVEDRLAAYGVRFGRAA